MGVDFKDITYDEIKNLYIENEKSYDIGIEITKKIKKEGFSNIENMLLLPFADNVMMSDIDGSIMMIDGAKDAYYRGEKRNYPTNKPSLLRKLEKLYTEEEKEAYKLISDMRIYEFKRFLEQFGYIKDWSNEICIDVFYEKLAQHYGLETSLLDITSHFIVALFFATCTFDNNINKWRPLSNEEIEEYEYGIIYRKVAGIDIRNTMMIIENQEGAIKPIGKQPLKRCEFQNAYTTELKTKEKLTDIGFEKLRFKHSVELSNSVYKKMNCGRSIYPIEGMEDMNEEINTIRTLEEFSSEAFEFAFNKNNYFETRESAKRELSNLKGYNIKIIEGKELIKVSRQRIKKFNKKYEKLLSKEKVTEVIMPVFTYSEEDKNTNNEN